MAIDNLPDDIETIKKLLLLPDDVESIEIVIAISSMIYAVKRFQTMAIKAEEEIIDLKKILHLYRKEITMLNDLLINKYVRKGS